VEIVYHCVQSITRLGWYDIETWSEIKYINSSDILIASPWAGKVGPSLQ
jgi:hypothetical protein